MTQESVKTVSETFNPMEDENLPEYAKEQVPGDFSCFSQLLISDLTLSISSWFRPPNSFEKPIATWACPLFFDCPPF